MTRFAATNATEAAASANRPVEFITISFPGIGTQRMTTAPKDLTWGGNTYSHDKRLGEIGGYTESRDMGSHSVKISLSGADSGLISEVLNQDIHWIDIDYAVGFLNADGDLVTDPVTFNTWQLGSCSVELGASPDIIQIAAETPAADLARANGSKANAVTQRERNGGDGLFDYTATLVTKEVVWGGAKVSPGSVRSDRITTNERAPGRVPGLPAQTPRRQPSDNEQ